MSINEKKLEAIKKIVKDEYQDQLSDEAVDSLAGELYYSLFIGEYGLDDLVSIIFSNEEYENIEKTGDWCYMFGQLIDLLEDGEKTAKRLYNNFMEEFDLLDTFLKLSENVEYLSAEQWAKAKEKAFETFDNEVLKLYGFEE